MFSTSQQYEVLCYRLEAYSMLPALHLVQDLAHQE